MAIRQVHQPSPGIVGLAAYAGGVGDREERDIDRIREMAKERARLDLRREEMGAMEDRFERGLFHRDKLARQGMLFQGAQSGLDRDLRERQAEKDREEREKDRESREKQAKRARYDKGIAEGTHEYTEDQKKRRDKLREGIASPDPGLHPEQKAEDVAEARRELEEMEPIPVERPKLSLGDEIQKKKWDETLPGGGTRTWVMGRDGRPSVEVETEAPSTFEVSPEDAALMKSEGFENYSDLAKQRRSVQDDYDNEIKAWTSRKKPGVEGDYYSYDEAKAKADKLYGDSLSAWGMGGQADQGPNAATQGVLDSVAGGASPSDAAIKAARSGDPGAQAACDNSGIEWRTIGRDPIEEEEPKPFGGRDRRAEFKAIKEAQAQGPEPEPFGGRDRQAEFEAIKEAQKPQSNQPAMLEPELEGRAQSKPLPPWADNSNFRDIQQGFYGQPAAAAAKLLLKYM